MSSNASSAASRGTRPKRPADIAVKRLNGIGHVLSDLNVAELQTEEELTRALWTLDTADKCVRAIMAEFRTEPPTEQVVRTSQKLISLIAHARDELHSGSRTPS